MSSKRDGRSARVAFRSRPQEALFDENPRQGGVFTISNSSTPDAERLAQGCSYQCSRLLASASVSGQKLLTFQGIYHVSRSTLEGWTNIQEMVNDFQHGRVWLFNVSTCPPI